VPLLVIPINIDPTIVSIGPLVFTWHGLFTAVGLAAGVWLAVRIGVNLGLTEDEVMSVALWGTIGGIVGARLWHVIDVWEYYVQRPLAILQINEGGLAVYGTAVGGPLVGAIYAWRKKLPIGKLADAAAPPLLLGFAIGRVGDIINGEHHSLPTDLPWAFLYTHPRTLGQPDIPVHPAVGYEMLWDLLVFGVLIYLIGRLPRSGMVFWTAGALYSIGVFFIRFFRADAAVWAFGLTQAQVSALIGAAISFWLLLFLASRARREEPRASRSRVGA
jgi:phosphatidylglycerol:prolipoprotein diacylglycerol transferase